MHRGIDLATDHGEIITAAGAGIVEVAGRWHDLGNPEYARLGRFVMIRHGNTNYKSIYGHCSVILVKKGQWVKAGQTIAKVGNTGWSTGPHLHFSIVYKERFVDPTFYLLNFDAESIVDSVFVD
jgi:murein DD-endopeptidase MepM/ murein hydrolase activator NlpD